MTRTTTRKSTLLLAAGVAAVLAGCQSGQFGSELSEQPRRPLQVKQTQPTTLSLPQSQPFNITLTSSSEQPSLEGTATANATANPDGTATATSDVKDGGKAEATFQIGHAISNDTTRQVDFDFTIDFAYSFETTQNPEAKLPDTAVGLRLYARDVHGRLLRDLALASYNTENGVASRSASDQISFTLTIGPGGTLDVYLAGQTKVDIGLDHSSSAKLTLKKLSMTVKTRPAPPVETQSNEPG